MMKPYCKWATVATFSIGLAGCHDPAYKAKQAERQGMIDALVNDYAEREQGRPANLDRLSKDVEKLQARYAKRLDETLKAIEERDRRDQKRWRELKPVREEQLRKMMEGKPDEIPKTWRELTY